MVLDFRLKGTKCEKCIEGRDLILDDFPKFPCCMCKDRPNRNKDKPYFQEDMFHEDLKEILDTEAIENSRLDY